MHRSNFDNFDKIGVYFSRRLQSKPSPVVGRLLVIVMEDAIELHDMKRLVLCVKRMPYGVLEFQTQDGENHYLTYDPSESLWKIRCMTANGIEIQYARRRITSRYLSSLQSVSMALVYLDRSRSTPSTAPPLPNPLPDPLPS